MYVKKVSRNSWKHKLTSSAIAGAVILGALAVSDGAQGAVPNPVVTGPISALAAPGDASHNYPFFSTAVDLAAAGYIEEEFFFEGTANRYNMPPLTTATILDSGHPYRTRMIVRRPASASGFNGIVVMEWQNVTAGYDFDAGWVGASDYYIRRGFAWIGVSAQHVGIDQPVTGLRYWSPTRYGTLDVTQGGAILNDALSYDIFSQAAQAVRSPAGVSPLGGLYANLVLAAGVSQAAIRGLAPYYNSIQPLAGVFDGFLLVSGGGLLRTDLTVKAFKGLSESDVATGGNQVGVSQPDSDHFRTWEVAGTSHLDHSFQQAVFPLQVRDSVTQIPANPPCTLPAFSRIPFQYVMNAATGHIIAWVQDNTAPPTAPQITRDLASPTMIARDSFGNALGGIRLSQHAVPTAVNTGVNSPANTFCRLFGSYQPFDQPTLHTLYRNHGAYVSEVSNVTEGNVSNGFLVQEDADATIQEAAQSGIGKP